MSDVFRSTSPYCDKCGKPFVYVGDIVGSPSDYHCTCGTSCINPVRETSIEKMQRERAEKAEKERDEMKKELKKASELLKEIWALHRDPGAAEYNHCDNGEDCQWCVEAKEIIEKEAGR